LPLVLCHWHSVLLVLEYLLVGRGHRGIQTKVQYAVLDLKTEEGRKAALAIQKNKNAMYVLQVALPHVSHQNIINKTKSDKWKLGIAWLAFERLRERAIPPLEAHDKKLNDAIDEVTFGKTTRQINSMTRSLKLNVCIEHVGGSSLRK
jgi:hypothetical protein